ncbi:MAG: SusC/RagA family TonB-linked outer membrane protein, partial [Chitinophagaceae bacterium]
MKKGSMIAEAIHALKKPFIIMKLTLVLIVFCTFQTSAGANAQTVTYSAENREIAKVLSSIEKKGDFRFVYNSRLKDLKQKVSVSFTKTDITDALKQLFNGTSLTYIILDNNLIAIRSANADEADIKVEGRVTNESGEPVIGASISVKGSSTGTFTDATGSFSLTVPENAVLVISAVGYTSTEVSVNGRSSIDVRLAQSQNKMDEVVVIGYGSASRRDLTGSVAKVRGDELAIQPNANAVSSLQSKVAGVNIVNTAIPGAAPDVRIRGTVSIGTIRPVYIIDGIFADNMDFINPNEIESIEILKDPSSLAVFGIKGAAGAILVTTKKAKAGQVLINFNTTYGSKKLVDKIAMANGQQFRDLLTFEANNRVQDDPAAISLKDFIDNGGLTAYNGNTDWVDAVTRTAKFATTNLSVDASTEKNRFHFGLGYTYDEGLVKHVRYDRLNINLNDEFKLSKRLKIGFGVVGSRERLPYNSGALEAARRALPIIPDGTSPFFTKNPYGIDSNTYNLYAQTPIIQNSESNPMATLEIFHDKKIDSRDRLLGNVFVDLNITKDLSFRSTWYGNMSWRNNRVQDDPAAISLKDFIDNG